jgi:ribose 5-phosphate isomerase B
MIALACDHGGFELMGAVKSYLDDVGLKYKDFGTHSSDSCDYPQIATPAAHAVAGGECDKGIFICGTGIGISIAANKTPGIRAALCTDCFMADKARTHNDANVLALGARVIDADLAIKIIEVFLNTDFSGDDRHLRRVNMLKDLDKKEL